MLPVIVIAILGKEQVVDGPRSLFPKIKIVVCVALTYVHQDAIQDHRGKDC